MFSTRANGQGKLMTEIFFIPPWDSLLWRVGLIHCGAQLSYCCCGPHSYGPVQLHTLRLLLRNVPPHSPRSPASRRKPRQRRRLTGCAGAEAVYCRGQGVPLPLRRPARAGTRGRRGDGVVSVAVRAEEDPLREMVSVSRSRAVRRCQRSVLRQPMGI
jgi:hypothetical protein